MSDEIKGKNPRIRGKNFDTAEIQLLTDLVEKNIEIINSKFSNTLTNEKKKKIWDNITEQINAMGLSSRTVKEVKTKWINMHQAAKKEYCDNKLYRRQTGGGPCPKPMSQVTEKIVELFKDSPSFDGLSGFETQSATEPPMLNSPNTVNLLSDLLVSNVCPSQPKNNNYIGLNIIEVEPTCAEDNTTTVNLNVPLSTDSTQSRLQICPPVKPRQKIKADDVTRMQYEVLVEQKKKLQEQTTFYRLMNRKLRMEMGLPNED